MVYIYNYIYSKYRHEFLGWGSQVVTTTRTIGCCQGQLGIVVVDVVSVEWGWGWEGAGRGRETKMCTRVKFTVPYTEKPLPAVGKFPESLSKSLRQTQTYTAPPVTFPGRYACARRARLISAVNNCSIASSNVEREREKRGRERERERRGGGRK